MNINNSINININNITMSSVSHVCESSFADNVSNHADILWNINGEYIMMCVKDNHSSPCQYFYQQILECVKCEKCTTRIILLSNMYGQNGPLLANSNILQNGPLLANSNILQNTPELLSELYDKSMSNFQRIFIENHIDSVHTIINPVIYNSKYNKSSTIELQQILTKYWIPIHDILTTITLEWNMAGKCHAVRQFVRSILSILPAIHLDTNNVKKYIEYMDIILRKFCIPFEHVIIHNRITISVSAIIDLYNSGICIEKFILTNMHIYKISTEKLPKTQLKHRLIDIIKNQDFQ